MAQHAPENADQRALVDGDRENEDNPRREQITRQISMVTRIFSCLSVGEFKKRKDGFTKYDGSMTAVLILVLLASTAITMIVSQWLTRNRVNTPVQPFHTELLLLLLILPGMITIIKAFCQRDSENRVRHEDQHTQGLHEIIETIGLYTFALASIAFDLLNFISEILCHQIGTKPTGVIDIIQFADTICDLIFFLVKPLFTIAQCMFLRRFAQSRFSNESHQQIFLISIIGANISIWFYTLINDEGDEIFDDPMDHFRNKHVQNCTVGLEGDWKAVQEIRPFFTPFTLEFTLLASEKLLRIWYGLTNLEWSEAELRRRQNYHNVEQLIYRRHLAEKRHQRYSNELNSYTQRQHRMRFWIGKVVTEMRNLGDRLARQPREEERPPIVAAEENQRKLLISLRGHRKNITSVAKQARSIVAESANLLYIIQEMRLLTEFKEAAQTEGVNALIDETDRELEQLQDEMDKGQVEIDGYIKLYDRAITKANESQIQEGAGQARGVKCGKWCSFGLFLGAGYFALGLTLLILHKSTTDDAGQPIDGADNWTSNQTFIELLYVFQGAEIIIQCILTGFVMYGFYKLSFLPSNHSGFKVMDTIYVFITSGYFMFAVFSIISGLYTTDSTRAYNWLPHQINDTAHVNFTCMGENHKDAGHLSNFSNVAVCAKFLKLLSTFLTTSFILYASQSLPHGNLEENSAVCEIIQLITVLYFMFWIVGSFFMNTVPHAFYLVGDYYFGNSFKVIVRVTLPITIYYDFATAVRGFDINSRFTQLP